MDKEVPPHGTAETAVSSAESAPRVPTVSTTPPDLRPDLRRQTEARRQAPQNPETAERQPRPEQEAAAPAGGERADPAGGDRADGDQAGRDPGARKKRNRRLLIFLGVAIAILAIGALAWWYFYARFYTSTDDAFIDARIVRIAPQVEGRLVEVPIDSDTRVKTGEVLARIDPAGPRASFDQASATVAGARTGVTSAEAQLEEAKAAVDQSQSAYQAAEVDAQNDQRNLDRLTSLKQSSGNTAVSQQQIDDAEASAHSAQAQAEKAKTAVTSARASVDAARAAVASAQAKLQEAQASLTSAQVTVNYLTITAPIDGQIVQVNVNKGSYVQPGQQIMALVPNRIYVTANFKETQLSKIHPGNRVDIRVDAYPDVDFHGHVVAIQRGAGQAFQLLPPQNATGNFVKVVQRVPVRIEIDGPDLSKYVLGPGMSVVPTVRIGSP